MGEHVYVGISQHLEYLFWGASIIKTIICWGLYWGPPILWGNYNISVQGGTQVVGYSVSIL